MLQYGNRCLTQKIQIAWTCAQNGTENDSQEGLKMEFSRQKESENAKNDPEKKPLKETED